MKTILATAYAINPYKGSEDAMGWNYVTQIARFNKIIAVTRKNNRTGIEKYLSEHSTETTNNIEFLYFDLPYWLRFWKRGSKGALLYFYLWQLLVPFFILKQKKEIDIVHNLNFHNDWTPTWLWILRKPMVWGPIGHHPKIPRNFILNTFGYKHFIADRLRWVTKKFFWNFSLALRLSASKSDKVICMNSSVTKSLKIDQKKVITINSVCSEPVNITHVKKHKFTVLFVGRFVALKGVDVAVRSFAKFYHLLNSNMQQHAEFVMVGKGPEEETIKQLAIDLRIDNAIKIIPWINRAELDNYYNASSVFLFPSHEGAGMVVPEALSYGLPIVCFDNVGPGEFIDESCGIKIPYGNYQSAVNDFAKNLYKLFYTPTLRNKLSEGALQNYFNRFSWNKRGALLNEIYNELLNKTLVS